MDQQTIAGHVLYSMVFSGLLIMGGIFIPLLIIEIITKIRLSIRRRKYYKNIDKSFAIKAIRERITINYGQAINRTTNKYTKENSTL
jgi:hypothetical protein